MFKSVINVAIPVNILDIMKQFSTQRKCISYLEKVRWDKKPKCPYCSSDRATKVKDCYRYYHCGACNKQYSVLVNTIFHDTKIPLKTWFLAISIIINAKKGISSLQLARDLDVNPKTAWRMQMQIRTAMAEKGQSELLKGIVECDEVYIGGKKKKGDKKKDDDNNFINPRGRGTNKQAVIGCVERGGKVKAQVQNNFSFTDIKAFLLKHVDFGSSKLYTDDFRGYIPFKKIIEHSIVNHSKGEYSRDGIHTNTIEGFWGLFKRSIVGSYHRLSVKYLDRYIQECCFKHNSRNNGGMV